MSDARGFGLLMAWLALMATMLHICLAFRAMRREDVQASFRQVMLAVGSLATGFAFGVAGLLS